MDNEDVLMLALSLTRVGAVDDCHFLSHKIGHAAFEENPDVYENLEGVSGEICRGGFYHGVLSAYFHEIKQSGEPFPNSYKTICDDFIGTSNYSHCIHGLGHGFIHYYLDDLESSMDSCNQMSFYQNYECLSGVFMQYSDNKLTRYGLSNENISTLCNKSKLNKFEYEECSKVIGITLTFHTNHNLEEGIKFCEMIDDNEGKQYCIAGLEQEIQTQKLYFTSPPHETQIDKFQPKWIKQGDKKWIVDFRSPAIISDFYYVEERQAMQFSIDKRAVIRIYVWSDLLPEKLEITIDGVHEKNAGINFDEYEGYTMIKILPSKSGTILITGN